MTVSVTGLRRLAALALAGSVLGCSTVPAVTSSPTEGPLPSPVAGPATPRISQPPTPPPLATAEPPLGQHWAPILVAGDRPTMYDAAYGEAGFVIVGSTCATLAVDCSRNTAAAWFAGDGGVWERATVADAKSAEMTAVAYNGTYFAAGTRLEDAGDGVLLASGVLWRSADGRDWASAGALDLGDCDDENGCPYLGQFEVNQAGLMLATWTGGVTPRQNGTYRSTDGRRWTEVDPALVGRTRANADVSATLVLDDALLLAWPDPDSEANDLWRTETGRTWTQIARLPAFAPSLTTDGRQIVAAGYACPGDVCQTSVWSSRDGGPFEPLGAPLGELSDVHIGFAGNAGFVLVGEDQDGLVVLGSSDATSWAERPPDFDFGDCDIRTLSSGPSSVIMISEFCRNAWMSQGSPS